MAICILLVRGLQPLLFNQLTWATPFVKEFSQQGGTIGQDPKKRSARSATILLLIFLVGLGLSLVTVFHPHLNTTAVAPAISWVLVTDLPKIKNPFDVKIRPSSLS